MLKDSIVKIEKLEIWRENNCISIVKYAKWYVLGAKNIFTTG